ncbi:MAG: ABC transporter permease [Lachnospiraceae bacterium]|nr:ABC transporter permease [Lachnospiraceae bacterium]MBQ9232987.1 ABC transporter permease [Lachnospiraceae bacterium]
MIENIRLSFQGIWAHKMRSFLTMLGIIIGIAAIIAIVSTIKGTSEQIKDNLVGSGSSVVKVELYQGDWNYVSGDGSGGNKLTPFNDSLKDEILDLDEVTAVAAYRMGSMYNGIMYNDNMLNNATFVGVDEDYFTVMGYSVKKGRVFAEHDRKNYNKFVVLDSVAADTLFSGEKDVVGKTVIIRSDAYVVIGVVEQQDSFSPKVENLNDWYTYYGTDIGGKIFVTDDVWPMLFGFDEPYNVVVKPRSTEDMTRAGRKTADILNNYIGVNNGAGGMGDTNEDESMGMTLKYRSEDLLEKAKALQEVSASTSKQLIWIASISLIVGGIGVMNIMLVSVTERTREIGLKKALGARKKVILAQFLTEAAVLTSLGGVIGVGAGIGLAYIIADVAKVPVAISGVAIIVSVVFSMVIGIVFGFIPSVKAANLNPIDALRYE